MKDLYSGGYFGSKYAHKTCNEVITTENTCTHSIQRCIFKKCCLCEVDDSAVDGHIMLLYILCKYAIFIESVVRQFVLLVSIIKGDLQVAKSTTTTTKTLYV